MEKARTHPGVLAACWMAWFTGPEEDRGEAEAGAFVAAELALIWRSSMIKR